MIPEASQNTGTVLGHCLGNELLHLFFCVTFFPLFSPCPPHSSSGNLLLPKRPSSGTSKLLLFSLAWAAANGGVTNGGLRVVWPCSLEISRNRPKSPFFCLFRPFPEGAKSSRKIQKTEEKGLFPQISSDLLKPPIS